MSSNIRDKNHSSIWQQSVQSAERPILPGNMETDIVIIGGGLTGILTAYYLQQSGRECVVLEADRVGSGQTARTTAKVTSQHNVIYQKLCRTVGKERAAQYADANEQAIRRYKGLIDKYEIDCDWRECDAFLYTANDSINARALRDEYKCAKELHLPAELTTKTELPFEVEQALCFHDQACFHPLKFLYAMAEKVTVYEQTKVLEVVPMQKAERDKETGETGRTGETEKIKRDIRVGNAVITNHGTIQAAYVVFACHYPFVNRPGYYFLRMHQERSYVLGLECPACEKKEKQFISVNADRLSEEMPERKTIRLEHMYLGIDQDALSFRSAGDLLLLGGGSHRTGENDGNQYEYLQKYADKYWHECKVIAKWSAQDCMTLDGIPYVGRFGSKTSTWYVATGFGKWGMTSSMAAALLITDLLNGRKNVYVDVYSPRRKTIAASAKTFVKEGKYAAVNILKEKWGRTDLQREKSEQSSTQNAGAKYKGLPKEAALFRNMVEKMRPEESKVLEYEGEKAGVYKDKKGETYVVSVKCPHLGCLLSWNADEKSWDCPCHGSRFAYTGELLDGPAQTGNACALDKKIGNDT